MASAEAGHKGVKADNSEQVQQIPGNEEETFFFFNFDKCDKQYLILSFLHCLYDRHIFILLSNKGKKQFFI